ncbi:MAG: hypothetical protein AAF602_09730 [Myxococcota bacterium]
MMERHTFERLVRRWRSWLDSPELGQQPIARQMLQACADDLEAAIFAAFVKPERDAGPIAGHVADRAQGRRDESSR